MTIEGALDGRAFLAYVEQLLAPTLCEGEIVVMDYVPTHKVAGVRRAIEAKGARVLYLPPYSPDFNPIGKSFSKIKSIHLGAHRGADRRRARRCGRPSSAMRHAERMLELFRFVRL